MPKPIGGSISKTTRISVKPYWNFSDSRRTNLSLDEFLDGQDPTKFFSGKEPWLEGVKKLCWQTFFRVCNEEMDDLSQRAIKLVIEYCLEILEEAEAKIDGKPSLQRLEVITRFPRTGDCCIDPAFVLGRPNFCHSRTVAEQCAAAPMERILDKAESPHEQTRNERGRDNVELIPKLYTSFAIGLGRRGRLFHGKQRGNELALSNDFARDPSLAFR
jgi:hypothetical protein